jgi:hypothetical protein
MKLEKPKLVLFHSGKTGGTSIEHTLKDKYCPEKKLAGKELDYSIMFGFDRQHNIYLQHADLRFYDLFNIEYKTYKTISTVRRPYERILSCYYYNGHSKKHTFEHFVTSLLEGICERNIKARFSMGHFCPQYFYVSSGDYSVDHIIHLENFTKECKDAGIKVNYHYSKTSGTKGYKNYLDAYNQKMKDIVYNLYKEDFKLFGYEK